MNPVARMMKRYIKMPLKYALPLLFIGALVLASTTGCVSSTNNNTITTTTNNTGSNIPHNETVDRYIQSFRWALSTNHTLMVFEPTIFRGFDPYQFSVTWENSTSATVEVYILYEGVCNKQDALGIVPTPNCTYSIDGTQEIRIFETPDDASKYIMHTGSELNYTKAFSNLTDGSRDPLTEPIGYDTDIIETFLAYKNVTGHIPTVTSWYQEFLPVERNLIQLDNIVINSKWIDSREYITILVPA
jgi:hypothetical protein